MKYVMFETDKGQKIPVLFPDALTHSIVAQLGAAAIEISVNSKAKWVSAGFVHLHGHVSVDGESESLGGLGFNPTDAARIWIGDSAAFMSDEVVNSLASKLARRGK